MYMHEKRGFTLIEVLLAITLLSVILGAGYSLYISTVNSFDKAEENWNMRSELNRAGNYITNELRHAFKVQFNPDNFTPENETENFIFIANNGNIVHRQGIEGNGYNENVIIYCKDEMNYDLQFFRVYDENDEILNDTLKFKISVINGINIQSRVMAANIPPRNEIIGQTGQSIFYKRSPDSGKIPAADFNTYCFIATAAYGSPMNPSITLLRFFRDNYLSKLPGGNFIIEQYYNYSPPLANFISNSNVLKFMIRLILYFVIGIILFIIFPVKILPIFILIFGFYFYSNKKYNFIMGRGEFNEFFIWKK